MDQNQAQTPQTPLRTTLSQVPGGAHIIKQFREIQSGDKKKKFTILGLAFLAVLLGVGTGWVVSGASGSQKAAPGAKIGPMEAGLADEKTFRDSAEGTIQEGGIEGEGTHHLDRGGGPSQYVYLTSTVIDLQSFVGKKVTVWGETISAKKAGWLMDVGKVKVTQ